jgi:dTDP-4-dehydrorhamnose 3,5-epimerase-like enzyme
MHVDEELWREADKMDAEVIQTRDLQIVKTWDQEQEHNGNLVPIWNKEDWTFGDKCFPAQAYLTTVFPRMQKGPHLHLKRYGLFCCVKGNVHIVQRFLSKKPDSKYDYIGFFSGEVHKYRLIQVCPGNPCAIINFEFEETALVLNFPYPAWSPEDQDEHVVEDWKYDWSKT